MQPAEQVPAAECREKKNLYELGEMPPPHHIPARMYASTIRPEIR